MHLVPLDLVDSHVHLDRYTDEEVKGMVARAATAGVRRMLTVGTDLVSSQAALALAAGYAGILAAVGIHPTRLYRTPLSGAASSAPTMLASLESLLQQGPAAIGEVGLDEQAPDLVGQARFLEDSLALAETHELPLVLHVVGSMAVHETALALVARHPNVHVVAHYFVGGPTLARRYLEHGCWIAVGRPVTRLSETAVRQAVPLISADRLLLETDTYPLPGRATEPCDLVSVCAAVAELTDQRVETVAAQTSASFDAFIRTRRPSSRPTRSAASS